MDKTHDHNVANVEMSNLNNNIKNEMRKKEKNEKIKK